MRPEIHAVVVSEDHGGVVPVPEWAIVPLGDHVANDCPGDVTLAHDAHCSCIPTRVHCVAHHVDALLGLIVGNRSTDSDPRLPSLILSNHCMVSNHIPRTDADEGRPAKDPVPRRTVDAAPLDSAVSCRLTSDLDPIANVVRRGLATEVNGDSGDGPVGAAFADVHPVGSRVLDPAVPDVEPVATLYADTISSHT